VAIKCNDYDCWTLTDKAMGHGNLLLSGVPGTGKSFAARHHKVKSDGVLTYTFTEESPYTDLVGGMQIVNGVSGPVTRWVHGVMVEAWKRGARMVLEEIDRASIECRSILHAMLDNPETAWINVDDPDNPEKKIKIVPKDGFHCVATTNLSNVDDGEGIHSALRDRFTMHVVIDKVHPDAIQRLPKYLRGAAERCVVTNDESRRTSIRGLLQFHKLVDQVGVEFEAAARLVWGSRAQDVCDGLKISAASITDQKEVYKDDKPTAKAKGKTGDDWDDDWE